MTIGDKSGIGCNASQNVSANTPRDLCLRLYVAVVVDKVDDGNSWEDACGTTDVLDEVVVVCDMLEGGRGAAATDEGGREMAARAEVDDVDAVDEEEDNDIHDDDLGLVEDGGTTAEEEEDVISLLGSTAHVAAADTSVSGSPEEERWK